jgi:hypothetical protein
MFQNFSFWETGFACPATYENRSFVVRGRARRAKNGKSLLQNNRFWNRLTA